MMMKMIRGGRRRRDCSTFNSTAFLGVPMVKRRRRITPLSSSSPPSRSYFLIYIWTLLFVYTSSPKDSIVANAQYYNDDDTAASSATAAPVRYNPVVSTDYCRLRPSQITVSLLSILCDTPGAYYSGSTAYRNSPVCVAGDKAQLDIVLRIPNGLMQYHNATSIYVQVEMGLYDHFTTVQQPISLCQMTIVRVVTNTNAEEEEDSKACPDAGVYHWTSYYTVPYSLITDANLHYVPDVRLTFTSTYASSTEASSRLGCVITGPLALRTIQDRKAQRGGLLFGLGCALLLGLFGLLLSCRTRRKRGSTLHAAAANTNSHYRRTLPNGVLPKIPLPSRRRMDPPPLPPNNSSEDGALPYGNPAYNETHLPSRPII